VKVNIQHILKVFLAVFVLFSTACSTKKKSWVNRQFHNTTAKYNGYFNGKESIKTGIQKLHKDFKDDYTAILPVYKTGDLKKSNQIHSYMDKAIKKGSIVIQRHSMKIKGKEYCKWIDDNYFLVGKAYFYKGEFDEAIKTFSFIKNEYKKNEIRFEASLWLIRSYVEKQDIITAEMELGELENERKFPKNLNVELATVAADFYLQQANYPLALEQLNKVDKLIKRKRKKVRYNYIMAQIYQHNNNYRSAKKKYEEVLKSSPEYEMAFNAKMNLAQSLESGSRDTDKMRQQLLKMTKDDKNKEYLDQIYFTLAEMDINNSDTLSAIDNYTLSTVNSVINNSQKALSFLALAKIDFNRALYKSSKIYYDSTVFYMSDDFRDYKQAKQKHEILEDLVLHLDIINMQDSLQVLANLPKAELEAIINQIIQDEAKKEREALEEERSKQQMMYENNRNRGREERFGNNTSGGKWYFYNPATLSFGLSEFRKKWGKRKLEDDWRRKDKKISASFEADSTTSDNREEVTENKKDPKYYTDKLPKSEEDFKISNELIKESTYQAGVIYKEYLVEYAKSTQLFMSLSSRFPYDEDYAPLAYYSIYLNHQELENYQEAEITKKLLLKNFPNSIYASTLTNPNFQEELVAKTNEMEEKYQLVYQNYLSNEYQKVIKQTNELQEDEYKTKYIFLRALSYAGIKDTTNLLSNLTAIIELKLDDKISAEVEYLLSVIKNPAAMQKANEQALAESPYLYRSNTNHMTLLILPKEGVDINYLKTLISDYHAMNFENEVFEISAMMMGLDQHLLMIKIFTTAKDVMLYNQLLKSNSTITNELNKSDYKILAISMENFKEFYKNKDAEGYCNFFKKNYLNNN
jgi:tetratricopeptide (TPR) repeat protein